MSLNPSNGIAVQDNPGRVGFPNLACRINAMKPVSHLQPLFDEVDAQVRQELIAAGILNAQGKGARHIEADWIRKAGNGEYKEVPCGILVCKHRWTFIRAWYYYVAQGPGIPVDKAEAFHKIWGRQVRPNGDCVCRSPLEQNEGFAVSLYHIDTAEGLKAFVELLASIHQPRT